MSYDISSFDKNNPNLSHCTCGICYNIPHKPYMYGCCDKICCKECVEKSFKSSKKCPFCRKITKDNVAKESKYCKNIINELSKYCDNKEKGCSFLDKLENTIYHENNECEFRHYPCDHCNIKFDFNKIDSHKQVCAKRPLPCKLCNNIIDFNLMKEHLEEECMEKEISCPHKCYMTFKRLFLDEHRDTCPKVKIICVMCTEFFFRENFDKHEKELCPYRQITCSHCEISLLDHELEEHEKKSCLKINLACEYKCGTMITRDLIKAHEETCLSFPIKCTLCSINYSRSDIEKHESDIKVHIKQINTKLKKNNFISQSLDISTLIWPPVNSKIIGYLKTQKYYVKNHIHGLRICNDVFTLPPNIIKCNCCLNKVKKELDNKSKYISYGGRCTKCDYTLCMYCLIKNNGFPTKEKLEAERVIPNITRLIEDSSDDSDSDSDSSNFLSDIEESLDQAVIHIESSYLEDID